MATIQIKNLSDDTVRAWKVRAASCGQSLQEYMRKYLTDEASMPTVDELFAAIEARATNHPEDRAILDPTLTAESIRLDRESH